MAAAASGFNRSPADDELDESLLYDGGEDVAVSDSEAGEDEQDASSSLSSEDNDELNALPAAGAATMELGGSGSARSTTLNVVLEEEATTEQSIPFQGRGGFPKRSAPRTMAFSLPVSAAPIKMGSSVPINIPHMGMGRSITKPTEPAEPAPVQFPATFVPLHELFSHQEAFTFSFTGESPGAAVKRDRLRVRNAILKSTGFLEKGDQLAAQAVGSPARSSRTVIGGLSQALGTVGSPGA